MENAKCVVCGSDKSLPCTNCGSVFYCGSNHRKKHWNEHKTECKPFKIQVSDEMGRFVNFQFPCEFYFYVTG